jgi:hypothetical protein
MAAGTCRRRERTQDEAGARPPRGGAWAAHTGCSPSEWGNGREAAIGLNKAEHVRLTNHRFWFRPGNSLTAVLATLFRLLNGKKLPVLPASLREIREMLD